MRVFRKAAVLILLGLTVGTPWVGASPLRLDGDSPQHVLHYLGGLLTSLRLKTGCIMDPLGRCAPSVPAQSIDSGCTMDPNGRCIPRTQSPSLDEGCTMDPNGRCAPGK